MRIDAKVDPSTIPKHYSILKAKILLAIFNGPTQKLERKWFRNRPSYEIETSTCFFRANIREDIRGTMDILFEFSVLSWISDCLPTDILGALSVEPQIHVEST